MEDKFMYYIIYKITNQIDGKYYIGSHKTKDLNDNYMGSGKYLKHAINKYGIENFVKEILFVYDNPESMYNKEAEIVNEDFLATENTYNLKKGGFGGWDYANNSEEILKRRLNTLRNSDKRFKHSNLHRFHLQQIRESENYLSYCAKGGSKSGHYAFKGKKHSEETKTIIGEKNSISQLGNKNSQFGTMWITNGSENKKIKKETTIPDGWYKGRK